MTIAHDRAAAPGPDLSSRLWFSSRGSDRRCVARPVRLGQGAGGVKGGQIGELKETPGVSAGAWQMRSPSRGYVEARAAKIERL